MTSQKLASWKMVNSLWNVLCDANEDKVRNIICATRRLGAYGSLRGKLFESLVHETLCARGDFLVRDLDVGSEPFQTSFPKRDLNQFGPIKDVQVGCYNIPRSQTFKTIDSLVPPDNLFQITVSTSHGINESGLDDLAGILNSSRVNFYFVTLAENVESFTQGKLTKKWKKKIHQKVLGIEIKQGVKSWDEQRKRERDDEQQKMKREMGDEQWKRKRERDDEQQKRERDDKQRKRKRKGMMN